MKTGVSAKLVLLAGTVLVLFAALEAVVRFSGFEPLAYLKNGRENIIQPSANPDRVYELVPGAHSVAWGTEVVVNRYGYRGEPVDPQSPAPFRVVALGDSITFGNFIAGDDAWPAQLQRLLQADIPGAQVINLGVGGYDTLQEVATLEDQGLAYRPDLVVVGYCLNDIAVASINLQYIERLNHYQKSAWAHSRLLAWINDQWERIRMQHWMADANDVAAFRQRYASRLLPLAADDPQLDVWIAALPARHPSPWYREPVRLDRLRYAFHRLAQDAASAHIPVVIVIFPWMELDETGQYPHAMVHRIVSHEAERAGLAVLDLAGPFGEAGMSGLRAMSDDPVHPNPAGHRIAAQVLQAYILQHNGQRRP